MTNLEFFADVQDSADKAYDLRKHLEGLTVLNQPIGIFRNKDTIIPLSLGVVNQIREIVVNELSRQLSDTVNRLKNEIEGL